MVRPERKKYFGFRPLIIDNRYHYKTIQEQKQYRLMIAMSGLYMLAKTRLVLY